MKVFKKILAAVLIINCLFMLVACDIPIDLNAILGGGGYTVTFLNYDNSILARATNIAAGEPAIYDGPTPTRPATDGCSYNFIGWDKDVTAVYSDMTVFAKYEELNKDGSSSEVMEETIVSEISFSNAKISVVPGTISELDDYVCFRDDYYYYFVFDLGKCYNVPIESTYDYYDYGGAGEVTKTLTASSASEKTVANSAEKTASESTTISSTKNVDITIHVGNEPPSATGGWSFDAQLEVGYSRTKSNSDSTTWSNSFSETAAYSESESNTTTICFRSGDPKGRYYYYLSVDTQVYGTIVRSIEDPSVYYATVETCVIGRGFNYIYTGDEKLSFERDNTINFDYADVITRYNLDSVVPADYYGTVKDDGKIHVTNAQGLYNSLKKATASDVIVLDNDIDCSGFPWPAIENFKGTLVGNGKKISNISYSAKNQSAGNTYYGLFKKMSGTIQDVVFEKISIDIWNYHTNDEYLYVGGICAVLEGSITGVTMTGCYVYGYNDSNEDRKMHAYVGGFCGQMNSGTITNCTIMNSSVHGKTHVDIEKRDTGDVWSYTGGFVGHQYSGTIVDCTRYDNVSVKSETVSAGKSSAYHCIVGGVVGYMSGGRVSGCISTGSNIHTAVDHHDSGTAGSSETRSGAIAGVCNGVIN